MFSFGVQFVVVVVLGICFVRVSSCVCVSGWLVCLFASVCVFCWMFCQSFFNSLFQKSD